MKTARILLAIILLVLCYHTANARIIYVTGDYPTIQTGIDSATSGDTVLVQRGTYLEYIDFLQKDILVASNFIFDSLEVTVDSTIIDGGGIVIAPAVTMRYVEGANSGITGFTIKNGYAQSGGGINCVYSSAEISHNVITRNTASDRGGGIHCYYSSATVSHNIIRQNSATNGGGLSVRSDTFLTIANNAIDSNTAVYGGGIECGGASCPSIVDNIISANSSTNLGGGIAYWFGSSPSVEGNYIIENESPCGGGIYGRNSHATVKRNVIAENSAPEGGGGISCYADTSEIVNNTFDNNSGHASDGARAAGICCWSSAAPEIRNNIIVNSLVGSGIGCSNSNPSISYNDVYSNAGGNFCGCDTLLGRKDTVNFNGDSCDIFFNISLEPLFDPDSTNYALLCSSHCIDAGDPSDPVPHCGVRRIDMGWLEFPYVAGDANSDGAHTPADITYKLNYLYRGGPPPCPYGAGDDNCDGVVNGSDVVWEISWFFGGGPPPCGYDETCGSSCALFTRRLPVAGEIKLLRSAFSETGTAEMNLVLNSYFDVSLVQLVLTYDPEEIVSVEPTLNYRTKDIQMYYSDVKGTLNLGILDIRGNHHISAGNHQILTLKVNAKNLNSIDISEALLVDLEGQSFPPLVISEVKKPISLPSEYSLCQNYPNPFNPETQISYDLPVAGHVTLVVYNIRGQKVRILVDKQEAAGHKSVIWNSRDEAGDKVASGIYFYRFEAGNFTETKKMLLLQ